MVRRIGEAAKQYAFMQRFGSSGHERAFADLLSRADFSLAAAESRGILRATWRYCLWQYRHRLALRTPRPFARNDQ